VADLDAGLFDTPPPLVDPNPSVATNSADFKLGREKCRLGRCEFAGARKAVTHVSRKRGVYFAAIEDA